MGNPDARHNKALAQQLQLEYQDWATIMHLAVQYHRLSRESLIHLQGDLRQMLDAVSRELERQERAM